MVYWTGDSFYEGPIWLFAPETDWEAYQKSVARLASLSEGLRYLLPAHNTPLASPENLNDLKNAVTQIASGAAKPVPQDQDRVAYEYGNFSLLLRAGLVQRKD